jgi:hypothetical protein
MLGRVPKSPEKSEVKAGEKSFGFAVIKSKLFGPPDV